VANESVHAGIEMSITMTSGSSPSSSDAAGSVARLCDDPSVEFAVDSSLTRAPVTYRGQQRRDGGSTWLRPGAGCGQHQAQSTGCPRRARFD